MSEIYLIRHGQASFGSDNYDRLSEKGALQADLLGRHLARCKVGFDAIVTGTMERQKDTARRVAAGLVENGMALPDPVADTCWDEVDSTRVWDARIPVLLKDDPGLLDELKKDRTNKKAFQAVFSKVMAGWVCGESATDGVGTWQEFQDRVVQGVHHIVGTMRESKTVAVFSSGGPIAAAAQMALGLSDGRTLDLLWQVMNASVTRLKTDGKAFTLAGFNNVSHLELQQDRRLLTYR